MQVYFHKPNIDELRKEQMLVDMHFHSKYSNDCSTPVESIIKRAKELGVSVALTDHNQIGGVLAAQKLAPGIVKPGVEICTAEGKDILLYFYDAKNLEDFYTRIVQPKLKLKTSLQSNATRLPVAELIDAVQKEDCAIALAHPFALPPRRSYAYFGMPANRDLLRYIHAFEVINQTMLHKQNLASIGWAMQFDKGIIGGTDGHIIKPMGSAFTMSKAGSWEEFLDNVKRKKVDVIGEERTFRHQMLNATNLLREKAHIIRNFRPERK